MRLLLCDDERPALDLLKTIINWSDFGITDIETANNGREAKTNILKNPPDIIVTDIVMPFTDGLGLSKWVRKSYPFIKIIILSAYNEFEYAQQAIKYKITGYLLKPIDEEKLEVMIRETVDEISNRKDREKRITTTRDIATERLLRQLLYPRQNLNEYRNLLSLLKIKVDFSYFRIILVTINQHNYNDYITTMTGERGIVNTTILKRLWERDKDKDLIFENIPGEFVILITDIKEHDNLKGQLNCLRDRIQDKFGISLIIAVSSFYRSLYNLHRSYMEVHSYTDKRFLHESGKILTSDLFKHVENDPFNTPQKDKSRYIKKAREYIEKHYSENINLDDICNYAAISKNYFCHLFKNETGISIWEYLTNFRIEKAREFLIGSDMKNYEISFRIGYENPSYFSKIFKKITGKSPSEFRKQIEALD